MDIQELIDRLPFRRYISRYVTIIDNLPLKFISIGFIKIIRLIGGTRKVSVEGLTLFVDESGSFLRALRNSGGSYEPATSSLFLSIVASAHNICDVGANIGYYSLIAAKRIPDGKIYSFEPDPHNFSILRKNCTQNRLTNIEARNIAISDYDGYATLYLDILNPGAHSLFKRGKTRPSIKVPTAKLDSLLGNEKIDLVKIDVEGSELKVLRGMSRCIKNNPNMRIIVEYNPLLLRAIGMKPHTLFEEIKSLGFKKIVAIMEEHSPVHLNELDALDKIAENCGFVNLLCSSIST